MQNAATRWQSCSIRVGFSSVSNNWPTGNFSLLYRTWNFISTILGGLNYVWWFYYTHYHPLGRASPNIFSFGPQRLVSYWVSAIDGKPAVYVDRSLCFFIDTEITLENGKALLGILRLCTMYNAGRRGYCWHPPISKSSKESSYEFLDEKERQKRRRREIHRYN